jgi:hypothetical protein
MYKLITGLLFILGTIRADTPKRIFHEADVGVFTKTLNQSLTLIVNSISI